MGKINHREKHLKAKADKRRYTHKKRNQNRDILNDICRYMHQQGITVHINASATSDTFYLKFDYGALYSLRISNHLPSEKKHTHRFNIVTEGMFLPSREKQEEGKPESYFFNQYEVPELKRAIMDQYHKLLVRGDNYYEERLAQSKQTFERHRLEKTNAFAVRSTQYDPHNPNQRYLNTMGDRF